MSYFCHARCGRKTTSPRIPRAVVIQFCFQSYYHETPLKNKSRRNWQHTKALNVRQSSANSRWGVVWCELLYSLSLFGKSFTCSGNRASADFTVPSPGVRARAARRCCPVRCARSMWRHKSAIVSSVCCRVLAVLELNCITDTRYELLLSFCLLALICYLAEWHAENILDADDWQPSRLPEAE